jgi:serine/threonine protein kinase
VEEIFKNQNFITQVDCERLGLAQFEEKYYKKLIRLGEGSFGEVWKCLEQRNDWLIVAVKYINIEGMNTTKMIDNATSFLVEKIILEKVSALNSLHIAKLIGAYYTSNQQSGNVQKMILVTECGDFNLHELIKQRIVPMIQRKL